jgi:hypothetical protein
MSNDTLEQFKEQILSVTRTCIGPLPGDPMGNGDMAGTVVYNDVLRAKLQAMGYNSRHENSTKWPWWDVGDVNNKYAPSRHDVVRAFEAGDTQQASELAKLGRLAWCLANLGRPQCGTDLNPFVMRGPWDGEEHEFTCPGCGRLVSMRFPLYSEG